MSSGTLVAISIMEIPKHAQVFFFLYHFYQNYDYRFKLMIQTYKLKRSKEGSERAQQAEMVVCSGSPRAARGVIYSGGRHDKMAMTDHTLEARKTLIHSL